MGLIPDVIKQVERPKNTEVRLFGGKYYVYEYISFWDKEKGKAVKKSLPYVGFIELIDDKWHFIPRSIKTLNDEPHIKEYANYKFIDNLAKDLYFELVKFYGKTDGTKIYVYSILRLLNGDTNSFIGDDYINSYISVDYPDVAVSKNSVYDFIKKLGKHDGSNKDFLKSRINEENQILIFDGTAIINDGDNNLSEYGTKAKKTKRAQISEIKVYDTKRREPIYYETIPGNVIDKTALIGVLSHLNLKNVIIIMDRGFNTKENLEYLIKEDIKFIMPLNNNSKDLNDSLKTNEYTHLFKWNGKSIKAFKTLKDDKFLYIYKDPFIAANQESNYIKMATSNKKGYDIKNLKKKDSNFGVIGFYSNMDLDIEIPYANYKERWTIETFVKLEKTSLDNEVIRLHSTPGVLGIRFIVQIEMIILARIYNKLKDLGLLKTESIDSVLRRLSKGYMIFRNGKWVKSITTKKNIKFFNDLNAI